MFITFEGLDYSGKSTQANLLVARLQQEGKRVVFLREPGGTTISEKIRAILLDRKNLEMSQLAELFLFEAARTQLVSEVIQPALQVGKLVVCDRFYDSTTVYQGYGRGLNLEEVTSINRLAILGTTPDVTFLIDVDSKEIKRRQTAASVGADRMESSGDDFYEKVRAGYHRIAEAEPNRFKVINGIRAKEEIHNEIWNIIMMKLT